MNAAKLAQTYERALALQGQGDLAGADQLYKRILLTRPGHAGALLQRATIAAQGGQTEAALVLARRAAALAPKDVALLSEIGNLLLGLGGPEEGLAAFDAALALAPDAVALLNDRGNALAALARWPEALGAFEAAAGRAPHLPIVQSNLGNAMLMLGREAEALALQDAAVSADARDPQLRLNRAFALAALGRREAALAELDAGLKLAPDHTELAWNRALILLQLGRFEEGWAAYEARKRKQSPVGTTHPDATTWSGQGEIAGKRVLLHWEQGFGDTIQMARYAKAVHGLGAEVILQVQTPLKGLIETMDPAIRVVGEDEPAPAFDLHVPLMSLPYALRRQIRGIPAEPSYLAADPARTAAFAERLGPGGSRRRAGLVWRGAPGHMNDLKRSLPHPVLQEVLGLDLDWVSLQKGLSDEERRLLEQRGVGHLDAELADFSDTAAAVMALDFVVSVDTSVVHLAGALGKPVHVLLPFDPDWRWLTERKDSPWYPSARLVRQPAPGDWASAIAELKAVLDA